MGKCIEINGKFYRKRKGKLVEIPPEWVGRTLVTQTKCKRRSNQSSDVREQPHNTFRDGTHDWSNYRKRRHDPMPNDVD